MANKFPKDRKKASAFLNKEEWKVTRRDFLSTSSVLLLTVGASGKAAAARPTNPDGV